MAPVETLLDLFVQSAHHRICDAPVLMLSAELHYSQLCHHSNPRHDAEAARLMAPMLREGARDDRLRRPAIADQSDAPHLIEFVGLHLNEFDCHPATLGRPNEGDVIERFAPNRSKVRIPKHLDAKSCSDVVLIQKSRSRGRPALLKRSQIENRGQQHHRTHPGTTTTGR
jgi:hypothetical protein